MCYEALHFARKSYARWRTVFLVYVMKAAGARATGEFYSLGGGKKLVKDRIKQSRMHRFALVSFHLSSWLIVQQKMAWLPEKKRCK